MEPNTTYEQEIDLKDLMFAVLRRWRPIVAVAVVLALLLGGYKAVTTYRSQNDPEVIEEAQKKYETDLAQFEKSKETSEREIENLKSDITNQEEYLEQSVMMNMSAYDVWESVTDLVVKTDYMIMPDMMYQNTDYTRTILQAYRSALSSTGLLGEVAEENGSQTRYLKELLTVSVDGNMLTIKVRYDSERSARNIMNDMLRKVEELGPQITSSIGSHTIEIVNESLGSSVDLSLANQQESESNRLISLKDSLEAKEKAFEEMKEPEKTETSSTAAAKSGIKFAVLGGVLGAFMVVFFVCVVFLMSDKVYAAKELRSRYRVKILGALPVSRKKKANRIDAWLNRLEGRAAVGTEEREYGLIAANIRNYAENVKTLLVAGTASEEKITQVAEQLGRQLSEFRVEAGGNVLESAAAVRQLPEYDGVVLVEQCGESTYSHVELEIEKIHLLGKELVGCVVFE